MLDSPHRSWYQHWSVQSAERRLQNATVSDHRSARLFTKNRSLARPSKKQLRSWFDLLLFESNSEHVALKTPTIQLMLTEIRYVVLKTFTTEFFVLYESRVCLPSQFNNKHSFDASPAYLPASIKKTPCLRHFINHVRNERYFFFNFQSHSHNDQGFGSMKFRILRFVKILHRNLRRLHRKWFQIDYKCKYSKTSRFSEKTRSLDWKKHKNAYNKNTMQHTVKKELHQMAEKWNMV